LKTQKIFKEIKLTLSIPDPRKGKSLKEKKKRGERGGGGLYLAHKAPHFCGV